MNRLYLRLLTLLLCLSGSLSYAQKPSKATATPTASSAAANLVDLNTATPAQLKALKGVGEAYSKRIIDGRPYTAKNQIVTRGVVPQATYDAIKDQIIARAPRK